MHYKDVAVSPGQVHCEFIEHYEDVVRPINILVRNIFLFDEDYVLISCDV